MGWLPLVGAVGWQIVMLLIVLVAKAIFPTANRNIILIVTGVVGILFALTCLFVSVKWQQDHPLEKKRTLPLDRSQFALAPTEARLHLKNDQDATKAVLMAIFFVVYMGMILWELRSPTPNNRAISSFYVFLALLFLMGISSWRRFRRYPLKFEAVADAEGLTIRRIRTGPQHFAWDQFQGVSLVEELNDLGARRFLDLKFKGESGKQVASVPLGSFKADDAAQFQSVVMRYFKPTQAP